MSPPARFPTFQGNALILPDVRIISDSEKSLLRAYVAGNRVLLITGEDATGVPSDANVMRFSKCPGKDYSAALEKDFNAASPDLDREFLGSLKAEAAVRIVASPMLATSVARVNGKPHVFLANFAGLRGGANPIQTPQTGVQVTMVAATNGRGFFLPFLGNIQPLQGTASAGGITYKLPAIEKGAVFWYEP